MSPSFLSSQLISGNLSRRPPRHSGTCNPIRMDISSTRHLGHMIFVRGSGEDDSRNLFVSSFLRKDENPYNVSPVNLLSHCYGRGTAFGVMIDTIFFR